MENPVVKHICLIYSKLYFSARRIFELDPVQVWT